MTNSFNLHCPKCGDAEQIDIQALVWVRLTEDGSDADASHDGTHHWESDHWFLCGACAAQGRVSELRRGRPYRVTFYSSSTGEGGEGLWHTRREAERHAESIRARFSDAEIVTQPGGRRGG